MYKSYIWQEAQTKPKIQYGFNSSNYYRQIISWWSYIKHVWACETITCIYKAFSLIHESENEVACVLPVSLLFFLKSNYLGERVGITHSTTAKVLPYYQPRSFYIWNWRWALPPMAALGINRLLCTQGVCASMCVK